MYPRRGRGYWCPRPTWFKNTSREMYGSCHNEDFSHPHRDFAGARNMPYNRMYNEDFVNCRNYHRGRGSRFHRGQNFRGSKNNVSKETFQEWSHSPSYGKRNMKKDNSQKVKTKSTESKKNKVNKEAFLALENKTCLAKVKDNGVTEDPSNQNASVLSTEASTKQSSEPTDGLPVKENGETTLLGVKQSPEHFSCFQLPPVVDAPFLCETRSDHDQSEERKDIEKSDVRQSPEHLSCFHPSPVVEAPFLCETANDHHQSEEKGEIEMTQNRSNHEDTNHEQSSDASVDKCINSQHTASNICCVPVLARSTRNNLPQHWQSGDALHAKEFTRWAPEDCQDPPWSVNHASKCGDVSGHDTELVPPASPSLSCTFCDQKCDTGRLTYLPKSHCNCDSKHSGTNCIPKKLYIENSGSSCSQRYSPESPCKQEHCSRSSHRQENCSGSFYRRQHGSGSPKEQQASISPQKQQQSSGSLHRQNYNPESPHTKEHDSASPHRGEHGPESFHVHKPSPQNQNLNSPERRRNSHERCDHCYCHNKHSFSRSQKNSSDERCKTNEMPHHDHTAKFPEKRKREEETEPEELTKHKTTLDEKIKFAKLIQESSKTIISPSEFSFRLPDYPEYQQKKQEVSPKIKEEIELPEKQTLQGHAFNSHTAVSTLPEPEKSLPPVLQPVMKEDPEMIQITATSENICSPHLSNTEEKTSSSKVRCIPELYSAAVIARKEAIEETYLQVLLNFAGVATMLVEKAPCMQASMDSALRANMRRIGEYYQRMFANYIDSLAEAS